MFKTIIIDDTLTNKIPCWLARSLAYRSMQMSAFLVSKGFVDVTNVTGGIHAYSVGVDPNVPTY